nr:9258_t:CDS:2 [Entrophospora candida]
MNGILIRSLKKISDSGSKFYKGRFDPKMNKREAALILGLGETGLNKIKIKEAH